MTKRRSISRDGVRGQHSSGRVDGSGSSPDPSKKLTRSQKSKLWFRLRNYDRKFHEVDKLARLRSFYPDDDKRLMKLREQRYKLDEKRRRVRLKLKGYKP